MEKVKVTTYGVEGGQESLRQENSKLKVFEAFAGIGAQHQALKNIGANFEIVGISEIDKFAIASYEAIHGEVPNFGDISKLGESELSDIEMDIFTYSFPCQDISLAGHQRGLDKGSDTRSSLLWECEKVIKISRPKVLLMENVKNLVGKKNKANFDRWLELLESYGYTNYWEVLNAKDYGVPQNRERVFVVSILGEHKPYKFPKKIELTKKLKEIANCNGDEKYYLNQKQIDKMVGSSFNQEKSRLQTGDVSDTLLARDYKGPKCVVCDGKKLGDILEKKVDEKYYLSEERIKQIEFNFEKNKTKTGLIQVGKLKNQKRENPERYRVFSGKSISPTLTTMQGGDLQPCIVCEERKDEGIRFFKDDACGTIRTIDSGGDKRVLEPLKVKNATKKGYQEATDGDIIDLAYPNSKQRRGRVKKGYTHTITTSPNIGVLDGYRVRKLTPLECWRLMGFGDDEFYKAEKVNSNSQLYKQAGNSIVVDVLEGIFTEIIKSIQK